MNTSNHDTDRVSVKIWDLPLRIFHWSLAVLIVIMLVSANFGNFDLHITTGKIIVVLLVVRIAWGLFGSSNVRFSALFFKPRAYIDYIKTLPKRSPGYSVAHSPIGSLAVIAILVALAVQVTTGLFATDVDGLVEGPFAYYIPYELTREASDIHVTHVDWLIALIIVHIAANAFYYVYKRDNLIKPMITGSRQIPKHRATDSPQLAPLWKTALVTAAVAAVMVWIFVQYG